MASNTASNVVSLSDHPRRTISSAESGRMLNDCRELAMRRLTQSLHEMLAEVEEELFAKAEATYDRELQNLYLEARGQAKAQWPSLERAFSRHFVDYFNRKARGELGSALKSLAISHEELRLVEEDDLAESIALQELAGHLRENCEDELSVLGARVAMLLGKNDLGDDENPVSPDAVCAALKGACDEIEGGIKLKLVLLKQIESHVSRALHAVYADLNSEMVRWNILPELKRGYRRPTNGNGGAKPAASPGAAPETGVGKSGADLFQALQQLIQAHYAGAAGSGAAPAAGGPGLARVPVVGAAPAAESVSGRFFDSLTQMQRGELAAGMLPVLGEVATANVLRQIKASSVAEGVGQLDAITIDIVAMLFDFIFDDAKIPDAIKALMGRLQIPVLKVAMLDKTFFSSKAHPARRLLDGISHASIGWGREVDPQDPLYKEIARIVERVQTDFERDVQLFADLLGELDTFLAVRETEAELIAERSAKLMQKRETEEIAWVIAGEAVSRRLSSSVPRAVQEFLLNHWQQVLKELYLRHGEDHHAFLSGLSTMDDLLWSVEAKTNSDQRKQLVGTLPGLLRSLHAGLDLIALPQELRNGFFDELVALHSAAVRAGLHGAGEAAAQAGQVQAEEGASAESSQTDQYTINPEGELFVTRIAEDDVQIEEVALLGVSQSVSGDSHRDRVDQLKRGDWVEFRHGDGTTARARLSWISPQRGVYLFTNPLSPRATAISPEALAHQFRTGLAEFVADEPLFDRAVNGVLGSLQAA